ncbi:hypothetical protein [Halarchaeum sp. P4]|uniref:hypothetical protein n=1 Tax=Halarchaeum sp. P4 TaxID=3421639 RepID=UPI003EBE428B
MWELGSGDGGHWERVTSPVSVTLRDVTHSANGPCVVGNDGFVLGRASDGTWGVLVEHGPKAHNNDLHAVDATGDGKRVWFAGSSGAVGYYDLQAQKRRDFSEPNDLTNTFQALTVSGKRGSEKLLAADGSGNVVPGVVSGDTIDWEWARDVSGAMTALSSNPAGVGFGVNSSGGVFKTTRDDGWKKIGLEDAGTSLYAVTANNNRLIVGGGNGRIYELEDNTWTPYLLASFTVQDLSLAPDGSVALAVGGSGDVFVRRGTGDWKPRSAKNSNALRGCAVSSPAVAVGKSGTIIEAPNENRDTTGEEDGATMAPE